ncbi:hypothetical protein [Mesorhizobium sp. M0220]|uniref:hypothetical protein n=1 Tax=Mesorhizobium sp. M0220 TaxID=2956920 RepID=UPI0033373DC7
MRESFATAQITSKEQFAAAASATQSIQETTPSAITPAVKVFVQQLGGETAQPLPVISDPYGLYGWCSTGVEEKVRNDGGSICFGWTIWEWPGVLLTSEFHAVWRSPSGDLFDITPKPQRETSIIFVPDLSYAPTFDFDNRPINRRCRLYEPVDIGHEVHRRINALKPAQRTYEDRRAAKAGISLQELIAKKLPADPLPALIDAFISVCEQVDRKLDSFGTSPTFEPDEAFIHLMQRKTQGLIRVMSALGSRTAGQ